MNEGMEPYVGGILPVMPSHLFFLLVNENLLHNTYKHCMLSVPRFKLVIVPQKRKTQRYLSCLCYFCRKLCVYGETWILRFWRHNL